MSVLEGLSLNFKLILINSMNRPINFHDVRFLICEMEGKKKEKECVTFINFSACKIKGFYFDSYLATTK